MKEKLIVVELANQKLQSFTIIVHSALSVDRLRFIQNLNTLKDQNGGGGGDTESSKSTLRYSIQCSEESNYRFTRLKNNNN